MTDSSVPCRPRSTPTVPDHYRSNVSAVLERVATLERENRALRQWLRTCDRRELPRLPSAMAVERERRRALIGRIRGLREELRRRNDTRHAAGSAVLTLSLASALVVLVALSIAAWPLAATLFLTGAVTRSVIVHACEPAPPRRRPLQLPDPGHARSSR